MSSQTHLLNRSFLRRKLTSHILPVMAFSALMLPQIGNGQVITTGTGQGADSFIEFGSDNVDNFGSDTQIMIRQHPNFPTPNASDEGRFARMGYLRFDLSTITQTPGAGVDGDVTLTLTWSNAFDGGAPEYLPWTLELYGLKDTSLGVTGDNSPASGTPGWLEGVSAAPGTGGSINGLNAPAANANYTLNSDAIFLVSVVVTSTVSVNDTLTLSSAALTDFILDDTNDLATLILVAGSPTTGGSVPVAQFWSKEGSALMAPTLSIIPEPSTLVTVLGSLSLGLIFRRRRCR